MAYNTDTLSKTLLGVGFIALAVGVLAAYTDPAGRYELSVYTGTPTVFWVGIGVALVIAVGVSLFAPTRPQTVLGLVLAGGTFSSFVGLPILRNYHFYGTADALTHLGWTRGIVSGDTALLSLLYPGIHTTAAFIGELTGYSSPRSVLYVVVVFAVLFVVFTGLSAWALTRDLRTTAVATFSACMLLPITNISSQLVAHTTTQALLFLPVVVYLLVRYLRSDRTGLYPTATGLVLGTTLVALVFYHPQQSLNLLAMFAAIAGLQLVARWWQASDTPVASTRPVYAQTGVLAVAFGLWVPGHSRFDDSASRAVDRIGQILAGEPRLGEETVQRGGSLAELGSGLLEIYLKLFGVTTVYCLLAAGILLAVLAGRYDRDATQLGSFGRLLLVGLLPLSGVVLVYLAGDFGTQSFRHIGFLIVFVTLLGAVGVATGWRWTERRVPVPGAAVSILLLVALALSAATVFPSPWIYLHSQHVTDMQMSGYETSFDHAEEGATFFGVREGPHRYADVHNRGLVEDESWLAPLDEEAMRTDLSESYGDGWYFALTRQDRQREVDAYGELRYSAESFDTARQQAGVNHVVDNGEFDLFYVTG